MISRQKQNNRSETGRMKEEKEKIWSSPTNRTIYLWSESSRTKKGTLITKTSAWTHSVQNRIRQKVGEIQALRSFERGVEKWCKEHITRKGNDPISEEGQNLLDDTDRWRDRESLLKECYESRKRERIHEDGSFMHLQKGPLTTTYSGLVPQGGRVQGETGRMLKKTSVKSEDQRSMLRSTTHGFPSNTWIHKITKGKESNRCDLCKVLWIEEDRFTTETALPEQDLGHIQHTCDVLSTTHTADHPRCRWDRTGWLSTGN